MPTIQGLEFIIESDIDAAVRKIDSLGQSLTNLKSSGKGGIGLGTAGKQLKAFDDTLRGIDMARFDQFTNALARIGSANPKISKSFTANLAGLQAVIASISDADISRIERLGAALSKFPAQLSLTGLGSIGKTVQNQMADVTQQVSGMKEPAAKAGSRLAGLPRILDALGGSASRLVGPFSIFSGLLLRMGGGLVGRVKTALSGLMTKITGFFNSIKRIAFYRLIRSLMRMITQGFTEGLKNMYAYSQAVGTQFAGSMDRLATSALYLKNSLASMAAPLINALAPAIDFVADKLAALFNMIAQFIARLSGRDTYTAAKKVATTWQGAAENATGGAKKAVDEFRRYVLGFDELNILGSEKNSGGSGGSGGAGGLSGADMFEERTIDDGISSFADQIRKAVQDHDWEGLGQVLGEGFNTAIASIPWSEAGEKVGTALNAVLTTADSFFVEADFVSLGNGIADFLNSGMAQTDFTKLGGTIAGGIGAAVDTVGGLLGGLNWDGVGKAVTSTLSGFFDRTTDWLDSHDWDNVGKSIVTSAEDFFEGGDWDKAASSVSKTAGTAIRSLFELVGGVLRQGFTDWLTRITKFVEEGHDDVFDLLRDWFVGGFLDFADWWNDNIFSPFGQGLTGNPDFDYREWAASLSPDPKWYSDEVHRAATGYYSAELTDKLTVDVSLAKDGWTTLDNYVGELHSKQVNLSRGNYSTLDAYVGNLSNRTVNLSKGNYSTLDKYVGNLSTKSVTLSKNGWSTLDSYVGTISAKPLSLYKQGWNSLYDYTGTKVDVGVQLYKSGWTDFKSFIGLKNGGIVTRNGAVKFFRSGGWVEGAKAGAFPAYAGGAVNAGSVFVAGEAGPELVAHVNNRSEVLNASQIAQTMYHSTIAGMRAIAGDIAAAVSSQVNTGSSNQPIICEVYLDRDRIATAVTKGQQAQNRRYSSTAVN